MSTPSLFGLTATFPGLVPEGLGSRSPVPQGSTSLGVAAEFDAHLQTAYSSGGLGDTRAVRRFSLPSNGGQPSGTEGRPLGTGTLTKGDTQRRADAGLPLWGVPQDSERAIGLLTDLSQDPVSAWPAGSAGEGLSASLPAALSSPEGSPSSQTVAATLGATGVTGASAASPASGDAGQPIGSSAGAVDGADVSVALPARSRVSGLGVSGSGVSGLSRPTTPTPASAAGPANGNTSPASASASASILPQDGQAHRNPVGQLTGEAGRPPAIPSLEFGASSAQAGQSRVTEDLASLVDVGAPDSKLGSDAPAVESDSVSKPSRTGGGIRNAGLGTTATTAQPQVATEGVTPAATLAATPSPAAAAASASAATPIPDVSAPTSPAATSVSIPVETAAASNPGRTTPTASDPNAAFRVDSGNPSPKSSASRAVYGSDSEVALDSSRATEPRYGEPLHRASRSTVGFGSSRAVSRPLVAANVLSGGAVNEASTVAALRADGVSDGIPSRMSAARSGAYPAALSSTATESQAPTNGQPLANPTTGTAAATAATGTTTIAPYPLANATAQPLSVNRVSTESQMASASTAVNTAVGTEWNLADGVETGFLSSAAEDSQTLQWVHRLATGRTTNSPASTTTFPDAAPGTLNVPSPDLATTTPSETLAEVSTRPTTGASLEASHRAATPSLVSGPVSAQVSGQTSVQESTQAATQTATEAATELSNPRSANAASESRAAENGRGRSEPASDVSSAFDDSLVTASRSQNETDLIRPASATKVDVGGMIPDPKGGLAVRDGFGSVLSSVSSTSGSEGSASTSSTALRFTSGPHELEDALGRALRVTVRSGGREALLELNPPELGTVRIELVMEGRDLSARISTERPEIATRIESFRSDLERSLESSGLRLEQLHVDSDSGSRSSHSDPRQRSDQNPNGSRNTSATQSRSASTLNSRVATAANALTDRRVDLRV